AMTLGSGPPVLAGSKRISGITLRTARVRSAFGEGTTWNVGITGRPSTSTLNCTRSSPSTSAAGAGTRGGGGGASQTAASGARARCDGKQCQHNDNEAGYGLFPTHRVTDERKELCRARRECRTGKRLFDFFTQTFERVAENHWLGVDRRGRLGDGCCSRCHFT